MFPVVSFDGSVINSRNGSTKSLLEKTFHHAMYSTEVVGGTMTKVSPYKCILLLLCKIPMQKPSRCRVYYNNGLVDATTITTTNVWGRSNYGFIFSLSFFFARILSRFFEKKSLYWQQYLELHKGNKARAQCRGTWWFLRSRIYIFIFKNWSLLLLFFSAWN